MSREAERNDPRWKLFSSGVPDPKKYLHTPPRNPVDPDREAFIQDFLLFSAFSLGMRVGYLGDHRPTREIIGDLADGTSTTCSPASEVPGSTVETVNDVIRVEGEIARRIAAYLDRYEHSRLEDEK
jgi:hypothetical protein